MKEFIKEMKMGDYASVLGCIIAIVAVTIDHLKIIFAGILITLIFIHFIRFTKAKHIRGEIKDLKKEKHDFIKNVRMKLLSKPSPYEIIEIKSSIEEYLDSHHYDSEAKILLLNANKLIESNEEFSRYKVY